MGCYGASRTPNGEGSGWRKPNPQMTTRLAIGSGYHCFDQHPLNGSLIGREEAATETLSSRGQILRDGSELPINDIQICRVRLAARSGRLDWYTPRP